MRQLYSAFTTRDTHKLKRHFEPLDLLINSTLYSPQADLAAIVNTNFVPIRHCLFFVVLQKHQFCLYRMVIRDHAIESSLLRRFSALLVWRALPSDRGHWYPSSKSMVAVLLCHKLLVAPYKARHCHQSLEILLVGKILFGSMRFIIYISLFEYFGPVVSTEIKTQCIWDSFSVPLHHCKPSLRTICALWSEISNVPPTQGIDLLTRLYFDRVCGILPESNPCITRESITACTVSSAERECIWIGDNFRSPDGECVPNQEDFPAFISQTIKLENETRQSPINEEKVVHTGFSYAANFHDCRTLCEDGPLAFDEEECVRTKFCCLWSERLDRCTFSPVKIASRFNQRLLGIAKLGENCKNRLSWGECLML
jgi:hypothetical protein